MNDATRWEDLADALAVDDAVSEEERRFVEEYDEADVALERDFYEQLASAGAVEAARPSDRQRAEATLAAFHRAQAPSRSGVVVGLGSAALAIAAALVLWGAWPAPDSVLSPEPARVSSGALMFDGIELSSGEPLPVDRWVVARRPACVELGAARGCVSPDSRLRVHDERLELSEGTLSFSGSGEVITPLGTVHAVDGSFSVELSGEQMRVESKDGVVELRTEDGVVESLAPGRTSTRSTVPTTLATAQPEVESVGLVEPAIPEAEAEAELEAPSPATRKPERARAPSLRPSELLGAARRHVAAGQTGRALATYATLRRQHPGSAEAHAANVSVGQLELRRGRAKPALRAFSRYLTSGGGALAEEAHWGKIRALHRLGRAGARDEAIDALRGSHPSSVYLSRASSL